MMKLKIPTSIKEINNVIEIYCKKNFSKNSSIKLKIYLLNKNEKKLIKENKSIILTEKEIQLLNYFQIKKTYYLKKYFIIFFGNILLMQILILLKHIYID